MRKILIWTALLLPLVLLGAYILLLIETEPERPEMFRDLPQTTVEVESEVDRRVKARFPIGTPEVELLAALSDMRFEISAGHATHDVASFMCPESFSIEWKLDSDRAVSEISGGYYLSCP